MNVRTRWAALAVLLLLAGCDRGQKPPSESWSGASRAAAGAREAPSGALYDLARDEEHGGHTLRKHVGRSDAELRERLSRERDISAASSWTDLVSAEQTVAAALAAERGKIASWQQRGERRPNLALHFDAGRVIGRSLVRGAEQSVPCTQAVIVLRADGQGFYVLTTYPEARE
ncbi:MAG TPA: RNase A-like domain-containing protein [Dongiaceae bacterium]|nr:RNase A-like domain-containing protein [Dongiaceae bacterium]